MFSFYQLNCVMVCQWHRSCKYFTRLVFKHMLYFLNNQCQYGYNYQEGNLILCNIVNRDKTIVWHKVLCMCVCVCVCFFFF
jgi:hypothetical protein